MKTIVTGAVRILGAPRIPKHLMRELRRADQFIAMAVIACHELLKKTAQQAMDPELSGLIIGTGFGPMQTNFDVLKPILDDGQASPTLFSHSVYNAAAGYISRIFNIRGSALTITDFGYPFFNALQQANILLSTRSLQNCIVIQIETYSKLLEDAKSRSLDNTDKPWTPEVIAWFLQGIEGNHPGYSLNNLKINTHAAKAIHSIKRSEKISCNQDETSLNTPAAAAAFLTETMLKDKPDCIESTITGPFGSVHISLQQQP